MRLSVRFQRSLLMSLIAAGGFCASVAHAQSPFLQTNLVSDIPGLAAVTDAKLQNPWGISQSVTNPYFWVSDQKTNLATLYTVTNTGVSKFILQVTIPTTANGPQGPTGQVSNSTAGFMVSGSPAEFIFANLNGTISAWNASAGTAAQIEVTTAGAVYTGLAIGGNSSGPLLYAANGAQNRVDVFDGSFAPVNLGPNAFQDTDSRLAGLAPFNVQNIGGDIYVTYAVPSHANQITVPEGSGAVAKFDQNGNLLQTLIAGGKLASPWGLAVAPAGFDGFAGDLLVGNFSYFASEINAFNLASGAFIGTIPINAGSGNSPGGLWALSFGNGSNGSDPNTLYLSAGINLEADGLLASIKAVSGPSSFNAAVLPASRSVQLGNSATAFATIINSGMTAATGCGIAPTTTVPASLVFQTTDPTTNALTGTANTPANIAAGASQSFVIAFTPTSAFSPTNVAFNFGCANANPAPSIIGVNTLNLSASASPVPDIVALAASGDPGFVDIPGATGTGDFAVATVNLGSAATITAAANTGTANLPVTLTLCQTNSSSGACVAAPAPAVTTSIAANATPTFGIFVTGSAAVANSPGVNRVFVTFIDSAGLLRGETSVAVRTQ
jgi:uncharacterized protein (TIGR03118 family)